MIFFYTFHFYGHDNSILIFHESVNTKYEIDPEVTKENWFSDVTDKFVNLQFLCIKANDLENIAINVFSYMPLK